MKIIIPEEAILRSLERLQTATGAHVILDDYVESVGIALSGSELQLRGEPTVIYEIARENGAVAISAHYLVDEKGAVSNLMRQSEKSLDGARIGRAASDNILAIYPPN